MYSETTSAELTIHQFYKIGGCEISPWHYTSGKIQFGEKIAARKTTIPAFAVDTAKLRELRINARNADGNV